MEKQQEQVIFNESEQSQGLREESRQEQFLMLPTVDFCFKELMEHEMVRHGFIAAVLGVSPNEIQATTLLPTNLRKEHKEDFIEMASKNEYINEEYNILKNISADEQKRLEYEARKRTIL